MISRKIDHKIVQNRHVESWKILYEKFSIHDKNKRDFRDLENYVFIDEKDKQYPVKKKIFINEWGMLTLGLTICLRQPSDLDALKIIVNNYGESFDVINLQEFKSVMVEQFFNEIKIIAGLSDFLKNKDLEANWLLKIRDLNDKQKQSVCFYAVEVFGEKAYSKIKTVPELKSIYNDFFKENLVLDFIRKNPIRKKEEFLKFFKRQKESFNSLDISYLEKNIKAEDCLNKKAEEISKVLDLSELMCCVPKEIKKNVDKKYPFPSLVNVASIKRKIKLIQDSGFEKLSSYDKIFSNIKETDFITEIIEYVDKKITDAETKSAIKMCILKNTLIDIKKTANVKVKI